MSDTQDDLDHYTRFLEKFNSAYKIAVANFEAITVQKRKLNDSEKISLDQYALLRDFAYLAIKNIKTGSDELDLKAAQCHNMVNHFEPNYFDMPLQSNESKFGLFAAPAQYNLFTSLRSLQLFVSFKPSPDLDLKPRPVKP